MIRRRRFVSRGTRGRRRQLIWARSTNWPTGNALAANASDFTNLLSDYQTFAGGDTLNGATVMRIKGNVLFLGTTGGNPQQASAFGITTEETALVSTASSANMLPMTTGRYRDWMYRQTLYTFQISPSVAGAAFLMPFNGDSQAGRVDIRSRRRIQELDSSLFAIWQAGPQAVAFYFDFSILLALP